MTRPIPGLVPETEGYWRAGGDGVLRVPRCVACSALAHPSAVVCRSCGGDDLALTDISGRGQLLAFTVNHQMWHPDVPPPYALGIVAIEEDASVRLTAGIVETELDHLAVGQPVEVRFLAVGDVWLPMFAVTGPATSVELEAPRPVSRTAATSQRYEHDVAITGIGASAIGRRLMRPPISLTVEACRAAIADAGLRVSDIDGLSTYPGGGMSGGITEGGIAPLEEALGIQPVWHNGGFDLPGQCGSIVAAMLAVSAGLCRHVLCFRTVWEATATELQRTGRMPLPGEGAITGDMQWRIPYGAFSASNWIAMNATAYFHQYGANRDVLGRIAINGRANAGRNPEAVYRDPITLDDYYAARMISWPFGLYDCDVPCDASVAVIVSARETAADLQQVPVFVEAAGTQIGQRNSWDQSEVTHMPGAFGPATHLWSRTDFNPGDVDFAELYDGFSFNCVTWIEALGFCGVGEATDFIGDGSAIALNGALPLNTHGGQLSAGRTHGYGFFREAVTQLRGDGADRQVADARVAAVGVGGGVPAGCFLLRRD